MATFADKYNKSKNIFNLINLNICFLNEDCGVYIILWFDQG